MGEIKVKARLENLGDLFLRDAGKLGKKRVRSAQIEAVVDTGAVMVLLPRDLVKRLGLLIFDRNTVSLADESKVEMDRAAGLFITVAGRRMETDCLVGPAGCEPLLGQIVMEGLDLIADPAKRTLTPRPEAPDFPVIKLKGQRRALSLLSAA